MCELKLNPKYKDISTTDGHTLTGVWVEISLANDIEIKKSGHTLTGVWVEINRTSKIACPECHTLTGVWVEIRLSSIV